MLLIRSAYVLFSVVIHPHVANMLPQASVERSRVSESQCSSSVRTLRSRRLMDTIDRFSKNEALQHRPMDSTGTSVPVRLTSGMSTVLKTLIKLPMVDTRLGTSGRAHHDGSYHLL